MMAEMSIAMVIIGVVFSLIFSGAGDSYSEEKRKEERRELLIKTLSEDNERIKQYILYGKTDKDSK